MATTIHAEWNRGRGGHARGAHFPHDAPFKRLGELFTAADPDTPSPSPKENEPLEGVFFT